MVSQVALDQISRFGGAPVGGINTERNSSPLVQSSADKHCAGDCHSHVISKGIFDLGIRIPIHSRDAPIV